MYIFHLIILAYLSVNINLIRCSEKRGIFKNNVRGNRLARSPHMCWFTGGCDRPSHQRMPPPPPPPPPPEPHHHSVHVQVVHHHTSHHQSPPPPPQQSSQSYDAVTGEAKCSHLYFQTKYVDKGTGSKVRIQEATPGIDKFTWFEAASCCRLKGLMLTSISNMEDLRGYYRLRNGDYFIGWSNVHGFEGRWRNLYGVYIETYQENMFWEKPVKYTRPEQCREIGPLVGEFVMRELPCKYNYQEVIYCEDIDPKQPKWNYDCHNRYPQKWYTENDWTQILTNNDCPVGPSISMPPPPPPPPPTYSPPPPSTYPSSGNSGGTAEAICNSISWRNDILTKFTQSSVGVHISTSPVKFNWFEAASCCLIKGWHLANIQDRADLDNYVRFLGGVNRNERTKAWTDIHSYSTRDWRNLKGVYIDRNVQKGLFWEDQPYDVQSSKGLCKMMEFKDAYVHNSGSLFIKDHACTEDANFILYCEESDPLNVPVHYGCTFTTRWYEKWQWEAALTGSPPCSKETVQPMSPPARPSYPQPKTDEKMRVVDYVVSKGKLPWRDAKLRCDMAGLMLLVIESQEDNEFLNNQKRLHQPPYILKEFFWSGARFASTDYKSLKWDPTKTPIPNFMSQNANGITKVWDIAEPLDDEGEGKDVCVDIRFPGPEVSQPMWAASDCSIKKNYICVRPAVERLPNDPPAKIDEGDPNDVKAPPPKSTVPFDEDSIDFSKATATWKDALKSCQQSKLTLAIIDSQADNNFLNNVRRLKEKPYNARTSFWSAGKFVEEGADNFKMFWEPYHKEFPSYLDQNANGITKKWVDETYGPSIEPNMDKVCLHMQFPGGKNTPIWDVEDCSVKKYYICMVPPKDRATNKRPAKIMGNIEEELPPPLGPTDFVPSRGKHPWKTAQKTCKDAGMVVMTIENEEDNEFLQNSKRLKSKPYSAATQFWSAGRFTSSEYTRMLWEPTKKEFPDFRSSTANGVKKQWGRGEPMDDTGGGKEVCVDMRFPDRGLPVWSASDCDEKKHFICMRPLADRISDPNSPAKPLKEPPEEAEEPEIPRNPLNDNDVDASKSKLPWDQAKAKCESSDLVLLTIESEADNLFLNYAPKFKKKPLSALTDFWSGGKFPSVEYIKMIWDPTKREFHNFRANNANGIKKWWATGEPNDDSGAGLDLCLSMQFPGKSPPIWTASDCTEEKYYICIRPLKQRNEGVTKPVKINDPEADEIAKELAKEPLFGTFYPDVKAKKPIKGTLNPGKPQLFTPEDPSQAITVMTPGTFKPLQTPEQLDYPYGTIHGNLRPYPPKRGSAEFIPDKIIYGEFKPDTGVPIPGSMTQDSPGLFTPDAPPYILRPTAGTWKPSTGITPTHPAKTVHGTLRPIPTSKTDSQFTPDPEVQGLFVPDDTKAAIPGAMTQSIPPEFTPYNPDEILKTPTPGIWKPKPNHPSSVSHGEMRPNLPDRPSDDFIPDEEDNGNFIPDSDPTSPIPGSMTKNKPQVFTPFDPTDFSNKIPGIWKPNSNPKGTHGALRPDSNVPIDSALFEPEDGKPKPPKAGPAAIPRKKAPVEQRPSSGVFVPDSTPKRPVYGSMQPGDPQLFTPNNPEEAIKRPTPGTFKPDESNAVEFPFSTLHGVMKPYPKVKDTSAFLPDNTISGEFTPDKGSHVMPGTMTQDSPPIFTPDYPPYIKTPTPGNWNPLGILPNHPCNTIHGVMTPEADPTNALFTPDADRHGTFTPDTTDKANPKKPIPGTLSQANPPRFTPDVPSTKFPKPVPGTWKPRPLYSPVSVTHGVMKPSSGGPIFVPDEMLPGKFIPDRDPTNPMDGYMTKGSPQIFSPSEDKDLSRPIPGNWKPQGAPQVHGSLRPDSNLPPNYALFEPGAGAPLKGGDGNGAPGKFYRDDRPKRPIGGTLAKDPPYKFDPEHPTSELSDTPKGTWVPDEPADPNDPFSTMHGVMDEGVDGPVFIPDILVEGFFIPDADGPLMDGSMNMETNPKLFTPATPVNEIRPALGLWRPVIGSPFYPFSTIRGMLKPSPTDPGSGYFTPDLTVDGEFTPQGGAPNPGSMGQGSPAIYTPGEPLNIHGNTPGVWTPIGGPSASFPFTATPGTLKPTPDPMGGTWYIFIPFEKFKGTFIPDDPAGKPIKGQATQSNPTKYLPEGPSNAVRVPTSGTWKPTEKFIPDDPIYYTHCVLFPPEDARETQIIYVPDSVTYGIFIPDADPSDTRRGILTKPQVGNRPVFKPESSAEPIYTKMPGIFKPDPSQPFAWYKIPTHGTLTPPPNKVLPLNYVYFMPDNGKPITRPASPQRPPPPTQQRPTQRPSNGRPAKPPQVVDPDSGFEPEENPDCDPDLQNIDSSNRFYVSCDKSGIKKKK